MKRKSTGFTGGWGLTNFGGGRGGKRVVVGVKKISTGYLYFFFWRAPVAVVGSGPFKKRQLLSSNTPCGWFRNSPPMFAHIPYPKA